MTCSTSGNKLSRIFRTATIESTSCGSGSWRRGRDGCRVNDLLHDSPRDSLLRPDTREAVRPRAPELRHAVIVVEAEVPRAGLRGGGCFRNVGRELHLVPTPWPWLSSVPVGRYGATLQPRPSRRSSAHASAMSGAVAPAAYVRLPQRCQQPAVDIMKSRKCG